LAKYRKYKWRFYADNNIEKEIVSFLRRSDIDVLWIAEEPQLQRQQDDEFHYSRARDMKRFLLTRDLDFWNDRRFPLKESPGLVILGSDDMEISKYLPLLLRKLIYDYNPEGGPIYIERMKFKLDAEGITLKGINHDTQKVVTNKWIWDDLF